MSISAGEFLKWLNVFDVLTGSSAGEVHAIFGTANQVLVSNPTGNVTLSLPQSIASTSSPTFGALTITGNASANNFIPGFATTVTAAAITTLTVASAFYQFFTGSSTQTVRMPVVSTLVLGQSYYIVNQSSNTVTVQSSGSNTIQVMSGFTTLSLTAVATSGTGANVWAIDSYSESDDIYPLPITLGGTAVSSVTTSPTASAWAGWDASSNLSANNLINGYTSTATAAATTTLTVASTHQQFFTGSTTQNVLLPVTSTLVLGQTFYFVNLSSGMVTIKSSGSNVIQAMATNTAMLVTCISTSLTTAAAWDAEYSFDQVGVVSLTGTANQVVASAATGAITLSLPQSIATSSSPTFAAVNTGAINDVNGLSALTITHVTSAVNFVTLYNNASGSKPAFAASGSDTDVGLTIAGKGAGTLGLQFGATSNQIIISTGTSLVHTTNMAFPATAASQNVTWPDASGTVSLLGNTVTGSGSVVLANTPTLVTPALGVIASGDASAVTGSLTHLTTLTTTADILVNSLTIGLGAGAIAGSVAIGETALSSNISGTNNTAVGNAALRGLTTGTGNTALGSALVFITTGTGNTAIGAQALSSAPTTSSSNTALGFGVLNTGTVINNNTGVGFNSLSNASFSGSTNTALGYQSMRDNLSSSNVVAIGGNALLLLTTGSNNVGIGFYCGGGQSGVALTTGSSNILIGYETDASSATAIGVIAIGTAAVGAAASGNTSGDSGPGISIGSASFPVGFRGDASIYPSAGVGDGTLALTFAGYWRVNINGTNYKIPLYPDA